MRIVLSFVFIACSFFAKAANNHTHYDSLYTLGNDAYIRQAFDTALMHYGSIIESGLESPDLYYNMGNAHYKLGQIPSAILYYEKALMLNPSNQDYTYNLQLANQQIVDDIKTLPQPFYTNWWNTLIFSASSLVWAICIVVSLILLVAWVLLYRFSNTSNHKRISFFMIIIFALTTGLFYLFANSQYRKMENNHYGIVFAERASIYSEPNLNTTTLFIVHEGLKIKVLKQEHNWYNIQLADGSTGWISSDQVVMI